VSLLASGWRPIAVVALFASTVNAQESLTLRTDVLVYGDNTEFHGPFREGETLFGATGRIFASIGIGDLVTIDLGIFGNHRFGGDRFDRATPIARLTIAGPRSAVVLGTLTGWEPRYGAGPDRASPHGLLPPIQRDNLAFERPYEAGLLWTRDAPRGRHEAWLNWQRLNDERHREQFDAGIAGRTALTQALSVGFQAHVVHEGGQLFSTGPVADSAAYAAGAIVERRLGPFEAATFELWGALSRHVPDREGADDVTGRGIFGRIGLERAGWRGHLIVWRACDFIKLEGDPNYHAVRLDGSRFRPARDYAEAGLTRTYRPAPGVAVEVSARGHRVEARYDYSFRILGHTKLAWRLR
jgi:hypothetical protein